jgi:hypothetical protein
VNNAKSAAFSASQAQNPHLHNQIAPGSARWDGILIFSCIKDVSDLFGHIDRRKKLYFESFSGNEKVGEPDIQGIRRDGRNGHSQ